MKEDSKIFVAGHHGLVGSAIVRALQKGGFTNLILKSRTELDLLDVEKVSNFFKKEKPEYVFMAAAKVGGILANKEHPAEFIYENLVIQNNVIRNAHLSGVKKLLYLACSCAYPKLAPQPIKEACLLAGPPEETSAPFAIAKIAGIALCESHRTEYGSNFVSVMPTNVYGPNDNFDPTNSHVIPALIRKLHVAKSASLKEITLWGTGKPQREFLYVDDLADACLFLMETYNDPGIINIGTGSDIPIRELAEKLRAIVGFEGDILWDVSRSDGTPRKALDVTKIHALGWHHTTPLENGLRSTYKWFLEEGRRAK